jgi:hypothetical protein
LRNPEDGGDMFSETSVITRTTRCNIPADVYQVYGMFLKTRDRLRTGYVADYATFVVRSFCRSVNYVQYQCMLSDRLRNIKWFFILRRLINGEFSIFRIVRGQKQKVSCLQFKRTTFHRCGHNSADNLHFLFCLVSRPIIIYNFICLLLLSPIDKS